MASIVPAPTPPEPIRFSLRLPCPLWIGGAAVALIVLSLGLAVGVPIYRQQAAIRKIERLGGYVKSCPRGPHCLHLVSGLDCLNMFAEVVTVYLDKSKVTDAELVHLKTLTDLRSLDLSSTRVTDAGLNHLTNFRNLTWLEIDHTGVTDAGLGCLKRLTNLEMLYVGDLPISNAAVEDLKRAIPALLVQRGDGTDPATVSSGMRVHIRPVAGPGDAE